MSLHEGIKTKEHTKEKIKCERFEIISEPLSAEETIYGKFTQKCGSLRKIDKIVTNVEKEEESFLSEMKRKY